MVFGFGLGRGFVLEHVGGGVGDGARGKVIGKGCCKEFGVGYGVLFLEWGWGFDDSLCSSIFHTFFWLSSV